MKKIETAPVVSVEQNTEVWINYLKENSLLFQTEKIKQFHIKLEGNSKINLKDAICLGGLFQEAKVKFLSAESKQERKNLGIKNGIKYFLEQNFLLSEGYINKLIQGYNNREFLNDYLETGHIGKSISIDNFNSFCNPKAETSEAETSEAETSEAETSEAETSEAEQTKFGGVTLTLTKASKQDIEGAIEYLMNLVK